MRTDVKLPIKLTKQTREVLVSLQFAGIDGKVIDGPNSSLYALEHHGLIEESIKVFTSRRNGGDFSWYRITDKGRAWLAANKEKQDAKA